VRTVELLPDAELDRAVRAAWARLAALGVPSLAGHPHPTNRPHVTLAAGPDLPDLSVPLPIPVTLDGVLRLGRGLAWRVVPTDAVRRVHEAVWRRMADPNPLHAPDAWVPHVSLARRAPDGFEFPLDAASGHLVAARSYDTGTRTVIALAASRSPAPER
jgi:hypothetical protein